MLRHIIIPIFFFSSLILKAEDKTDISAALNTIIMVENINDEGAGTLREAIIKANQQPGVDEINFLPVATGIIKLSGPLPVLTEDVIINGPGADKLTISGENQFRIFEIFNNQMPVTVHISCFTFSGGKGNAGAAIRNRGLSTVNIKNCIFIRNMAPNIGAGNGGALSNFITSKMFVDKCNFFENYANTFGGAIYNLGMLEVTNSTFANNMAFNGSAIFTINQAGKTSLVNCTISGNTTEGGSGGGVFTDLYSTTVIRNSTITLNRTTGSGSGGGVFCGSTATLTISSSIIAGNSKSVDGPDILGKIISLGFNLLGNNMGNSGITHGVNNDQAGSPGSILEPMLGTLQNNGGSTLTHALLPGSPAIDAGTCNGLTLDQRGVARPYNNACDIGSYEVAPSIKADLGPLTLFLGAATPRDNGKMVDVKAEILIGDSLAASTIKTNQRIAGHMNNNIGVRIDLPLSVRQFSVNPGDSIRIRVSLRTVSKQSMSARLWHNVDSLAVNSRGFSRLIYSLDSSTPAFLYLREQFVLNVSPGSSAASVSANTSDVFTPVGTWTLKVSSLLNQRQQTAARKSPGITDQINRSFSVIPNPSGTIPVFHFENRGAEKAILEIMDMTGRVLTVRHIRITGGEKSVFREISLNKPGLYLSRLTLEKGGQVISRETTRFLAQ